MRFGKGVVVLKPNKIETFNPLDHGQKPCVRMYAFSHWSIMKTQLKVTFEEIVSIENLLGAWKEFIKGKRGKPDVQEFQLRLMDNIF